MKKETETPESEIVRTTIVGGRPPAQGRVAGNIPRGIEVLVKKAAVDPDFHRQLLAKRAGVAQEIELELTQAETLMINTIPQAQLNAIIANTQVPEPERRAFLGRLGTMMLAAIGATACKVFRMAPGGARPDTPTVNPETTIEGIQPDDPTATPGPNVETGIRPDDPTATPAGIRPTPAAPGGIRPDDPTATPGDTSEDCPETAEPKERITRGIRPTLPGRKPRGGA